MTFINVWNGLPFVSFDDYTLSQDNRKDYKKITDIMGSNLTLGKGLSPTVVDDKFNNYSFFITLSMKTVIDIENNAEYYRKLVKWMNANGYISDYAFYFEYYNDKKNIHSHGVFNSELSHEKIKRCIRIFTATFYKGKTVPKASIMLKRISEYRPADYRISLQYCRKDVEFMKLHGFYPMEHIHNVIKV